MNKKIVALTGAGISAESGLKTFRDGDGLWEGYEVTDVATPEAWNRNPDLVLSFYNDRRKQAAAATANAGHKTLHELEKYFDVTVITQNVDELHEEAGSTKVVHLHGKLSEAKSSGNDSYITRLSSTELNRGGLCPEGFQLRPNIVWFGEPVPKMEEAIEIAQQADIFLVIGTSLVVYPAASLLDFIQPQVPIFIVDPNSPKTSHRKNTFFFKETATTGLQKVSKTLITKYL